MKIESPIDFEELVTESRIEEIRSILRVTAHWMAIPLFSLFWIADILYAPELKWHFLGIRILIIPICFAVTFFSRRAKAFPTIQRIASIYAIALAFGINVMIGLLPQSGTVYYAGLNLIAFGSLSFIPFTKMAYILTTLGIYGPYYGIVLTKNSSAADYKELLINSFFISSSICICSLIRYFQENVRRQEIKSRFNLNNEILNRDEVIRSKTAEAVRLNSLYSQFSPQVVETIRSGKLKLETGGQRAQVCAIFIDIVNSTERVVRIDKNKVEKVISKFLDDTIRILLKYDLTIDKFLGDGILAFCNAPITRPDYVHRVANASLEIRAKIQADQDFYERYWQAPLEIRMGIAKGYVNVGFYGSQKYYRSYTAIGPVINLASRLCSSAEVGQIVVDFDIFEEISNNFKLTFVGKKILKGFDKDLIHAYELVSSNNDNSTRLPGASECPTCGGILALETNDKNQFILMCKSCCTVYESTDQAANL